jgi:hypothetical protein
MCAFALFAHTDAYAQNAKTTTTSTNSQIAALEQRIATLEQRLAKLQSALESEIYARSTGDGALQRHIDNERGARIAAVTTLPAISPAEQALLTALTDNVRVEPGTMDGLPGPHVIFEGVNVHIRNGHASGRSLSTNGRGNLIVGYNEPDGNASLRQQSTRVEFGFVNIQSFVSAQTFNGKHCNQGRGNGQEGCDPGNSNQGDPRRSRDEKYDHGGGHNPPPPPPPPPSGTVDREGSHNVVIGPQHGYDYAAGLVAGQTNRLLNDSASILGGQENEAAGIGSSIAGGSNNITTGNYATVSSGNGNLATGVGSAVLGGEMNVASGQFATVSGGEANQAAGRNSAVSGGGNNLATGDRSTVSGGESNIAVLPGQHVP